MCQRSCLKFCLNLSLRTRTMQVLFLLWIPPDKMEKIGCLIHVSSSKMALKRSSVVKQLMHVLKIVTTGSMICSKETLLIMYLRHPALDMIQRIYLRCGSFGSIICCWILVKKRNIHFGIKNPDLDFSKEMLPNCRLMELPSFNECKKTNCIFANLLIYIYYL